MTSCYHQQYIRIDENVSFTKSFVLKTVSRINSERNCTWLVYFQWITKNHPIATNLLKNQDVYVKSKIFSLYWETFWAINVPWPFSSDRWIDIRASRTKSHIQPGHYGLIFFPWPSHYPHFFYLYDLFIFEQKLFIVNGNLWIEVTLEILVY